MATLVATLCLIVVVYLGDKAHWFNLILHGEDLGYPPEIISGVRATVVLAFLIGFILRNDVEHIGRGNGHNNH